MEMLQQQIEGLTKRLAQLKQTERIMLEAKGLEKQIAREKKALATIDEELQSEKEALAELQDRQAEIVKSATAEFLARMNTALPEGEVHFEIEDDKVNLGWKISGKVRPFRALSGGERVAFDMALAYALGAGVIVKECAELDEHRLGLVLEKLKDVPMQTVVITCHQPKVYPAEWEMIGLEG